MHFFVTFDHAPGIVALECTVMTSKLWCSERYGTLQSLAVNLIHHLFRARARVTSVPAKAAPIYHLINVFEMGTTVIQALLLSVVYVTRSHPALPRFCSTDHGPR